MTQIRHGRGALIDDRPMVSATADGGVRLELGSINSPWTIVLTQADAERIAEAIGWRPNHHYPPTRDPD
jgi:hypothetical protein